MFLEYDMSKELIIVYFYDSCCWLRICETYIINKTYGWHFVLLWLMNWIYKFDRIVTGKNIGFGWNIAE